VLGVHTLNGTKLRDLRDPGNIKTSYRIDYQTEVLQQVCSHDRRDDVCDAEDPCYRPAEIQVQSKLFFPVRLDMYAVSGE